MVANKVAENVLGTIGPCTPRSLNSMSNPPLASNRYHIVDCTNNTPDLEELSLKVYRRLIRLVGVSTANLGPHSSSAPTEG